MTEHGGSQIRAEQIEHIIGQRQAALSRNEQEPKTRIKAEPNDARVHCPSATA